MIHVKIAGGIAKYNVILMMSVDNRELFKGLNLSYYDMPNNCDWNGGRVNRSIELTDRILDTFNKYNYGFDLGFTNDVIMDLGDPIGNHLLEMVSSHNPNNKHGVILSCETLRRHIRRSHPNLKLTYSITGHPTTDYLQFDKYYKELESKYDIIVPKDSHIDELLPLFEQGVLDASKYELLVNDNCDRKCPIYSEHFQRIAFMNRTTNKPWESDWGKSFQIETKPLTKPSTTTAHCVLHSLDATYLQKFYDVGVRNFKLSGRDLTDALYKQRIAANLAEIKKLV